ncbi:MULTISPECIES: hypothetical protein [unclassified Arthrobacter]|nr:MULTISPECIES: hypothetical protein [unclassified Arthrobacter]MCC9145289.1 hypothetical protein [Arthrobacter sp. zg-Y919]MDK1276517.1 hypothetical protein [Arthrobacter sp. zg.Y919]MDM7989159.1 hypothetical protein [Arthrobacter sp. zg-Y877]WIB01889.1 hypothetical protein QNO10_07760 [Arthrobacter sp. zg-Y919]
MRHKVCPCCRTAVRKIQLGAIPVLDVIFVVGFVALFAAFVLMAGAVEKL